MRQITLAPRNSNAKRIVDLWGNKWLVLAEVKGKLLCSSIQELDATDKQSLRWVYIEDDCDFNVLSVVKVPTRLVNV